jgi:hypothetical protein
VPHWIQDFESNVTAHDAANNDSDSSDESSGEFVDRPAGNDDDDDVPTAIGGTTSLAINASVRVIRLRFPNADRSSNRILLMERRN